MKPNIVIISCSPKAGNSMSDTIAGYLKEKFESNEIAVQKIILRKEAANINAIIESIDRSDTLILTLPIYENSVPGLAVQLFESVWQNRNCLINKKTRVFVITNSGFADISANHSAIETCRLFTEAMGFEWLGGTSVVPGTLLSEYSIQALKHTYKKLTWSLDMIANSISDNRTVPAEAFKLLSRPFINRYVYLVGGYILQKKVMKKLGKSTYYAKPLGV